MVLVGIEDPLRLGVREAVADCHKGWRHRQDVYWGQRPHSTFHRTSMRYLHTGWYHHGRAGVPSTLR